MKFCCLIESFLCANISKNLIYARKKTYISWFVEESRRQLNRDANESLMNKIHWIRTCEIVFYLCNAVMLIIFRFCTLWVGDFQIVYTIRMGKSCLFFCELHFIGASNWIEEHCFVVGVENKWYGFVLSVFHLKWGDYHFDWMTTTIVFIYLHFHPANKQQRK